MLNEIEVGIDIPTSITKTESLDYLKYDNSDDSSDLDRTEERWTKKHNIFLSKIRTECKHLSEIHNSSSKIKLYYHRALSIPQMCLPLIAGLFSEYIDKKYSYISNGILLLSSGISVVNGVYNFGKKSALHNEYSGKYDDLAKEVEYTLCRSKKSRQACDVSCQKFIFKQQTLNGSAPQI